METTNLHNDIEHAIILYEKIIHHSATRTRQMIGTYGEVEALSRLVVSADLQKGFKALRDRHQLKLTFEAIVVRYPDKFKDDAVNAAQWRLENAENLL